MAELSKARVCGRSPAGIAGSNPAGAWMFVVSVVCFQVEIFATGRSLVQRSSIYCGVSLCVIKFNNPLHLTMVRCKEFGLRKKERQNKMLVLKKCDILSVLTISVFCFRSVLYFQQLCSYYVWEEMVSEGGKYCNKI